MHYTISKSETGLNIAKIGKIWLHGNQELLLLTSSFELSCEMESTKLIRSEVVKSSERGRIF